MRLCPVKSKTGRRTVGIPVVNVSALSEHLASYVEPEEDAFVFLGKLGGFARSSSPSSAVRHGAGCSCSWWTVCGRWPTPAARPLHDRLAGTRVTALDVQAQRRRGCAARLNVC